MGHQHLQAQAVTTQEPPPVAAQLPSAPAPQNSVDLSTLPRAVPLAPAHLPDHVVMESDLQSRHDDTYLLSGDVLLTLRDHTLRADTLTYNEDTGIINAQGHVRLAGGANDEYIQASHGTYNVLTGLGTFYDVTGSVGLQDATAGAHRTGYTNQNPFLFAGRKVVKTGQQNYEVYDGSVTSCLLPRPDWQLFGKKFSLDGNKAKAVNSTFKLLGVPILYLPYVTHPIDSETRQSGILIPVLSYTSSKGFIIGEDIYFALGRSADLTVGSIYYSSRGFSESATFRYRGIGNDFFNAHFTALQDRGFFTDITDANGNVTGKYYTNQGGEDVTSSFRRKFTRNTRAVGDIEYLSSYVYREAFTDNFNQAVSSDITSIGYITRQNDGYIFSGRADRYQGLKRVPTATTAGQQVRIFHAPSFDFTALDHHIAGTPFLWDLDASVAALKRVQPNFTSSGMIERLDFRPEISLPLSGGGWHTDSSLAVRETFYSRSRKAPYGNGATPVELTQPANRTSVEVNIDIRPPVIERTFKVPAKLQHLFGSEVRHTIEPQFVYRNVHGISNFLSILRFDDTDLASNTDELQYGVTQHLYFKPAPPSAKKRTPKPGCPAVSEAPSITKPPVAEIQQAARLPDVFNPDGAESNDANGIPNIDATVPDIPTHTHRHADPCADPPPEAPQQEWFSWRLTQRHFFEPTFGGAIIDRRRNLFDTTLSLSGIAFLTESRNISPLISRMRFRTSSHTDIEWDFDVDAVAAKANSNNIFLEAHEGPFFGGVSYARLNAPGRFSIETINNNDPNNPTLTTSAISDFSQLRLLLGYGNPTKPGLSAAANAGIDLRNVNVQYGALQTSYNWNCCGLAIEYRRFELGSVRNENSYKFNFTLANIGTAGNLRRAQRLF